MKRKNRLIYVFLISFVVAYFVLGYVINAKMVHIDWLEGTTIWQKLYEYYIRTFFQNLIPTLIIAIIATFIFKLTSKVVKYVKRTRYMK